MCAEFWNGWFDNWGTHHHTTDAGASAAELDALLSAGASVNIYMFHGGTNPGFTNGANDKGIYEPTITSYDYDAPLSEDGYPTEKYFAFRDVIARHFPVPSEVPAVRHVLPESVATMHSSVPLLSVADALGTPQRVAGPVPASEATGQYRGFCLYERTLDRGGVLSFAEIRDRAQFFLDGFPLGTLSRELAERSIAIPAAGFLQVLVEDQGRVNYGPRIGESKGLIGPAVLDGEDVGDWQLRPLDLDSVDLANLDLESLGPLGTQAGDRQGPGGAAGPQRTLYVPGPLLRQGSNTLAVLELQGSTTRDARFVPGPDLGPEEK